jgi:hypothetical protein
VRASWALQCPGRPGSSSRSSSCCSGRRRLLPFFGRRDASRSTAGGRRLAHLAIHLGLAFGFILATNLAAPLLTQLALGRAFDARAVMRRGLLAFLQVYHLALIVYAFIVGVGH